LNVANSFRKILEVSRGGGERSVQHALDTLDKNCDESHGGILDKFQPQEMVNILHIMAKNQYKTCLLPELEQRAGRYQGS
jgi:hypothetical protein